MPLTNQEQKRYNRHIILHDIRIQGQEKIKALYQRIVGIEQEYNDLIDKCRKFRTPQKAVQYLQKNGFDTSSLQNITKEGE